jgi:hypothetical protein
MRKSIFVNDAREVDRMAKRQRTSEAVKFSDDGWETVPPEQRWLFRSPECAVEPDTRLLLKKSVTPLNVFQKLMPADLVSELAPELGSPVDAYRVWGLMAYLIAVIPPVSHPSHIHDNEREKIQEVRCALAAEHPDLPEFVGIKKFERIQGQITITPEFARQQLSKHWASVVATWGETVALDEKMRKFRGASPHYKSVPGKTEPHGHWTTQLTVQLGSGALPFCVGLFPFSSTVELGETTDKQSIWAWVRSLLPAKDPPCIVADCYYLTRPVLKQLTDDGVPFLCAMKLKYFHEYVTMLNRGVSKMGQTSVSWSESLGLVAVHHWDANEHIGRKYVISNSFEVDPSRRREEGHNTVYWTYKDRFNYCDSYNRRLFAFKYPFRRDGWEKNFDSLFFSVLLINTYHAYLHATGGKEETNKLVDFTKELGVALMKMQ